MTLALDQSRGLPAPFFALHRFHNACAPPGHTTTISMEERREKEGQGEGEGAGATLRMVTPWQDRSRDPLFHSCYRGRFARTSPMPFCSHGSLCIHPFLPLPPPSSPFPTSVTCRCPLMRPSEQRPPRSTPLGTRGGACRAAAPCCDRKEKEREGRGREEKGKEGMGGEGGEERRGGHRHATKHARMHTRMHARAERVEGAIQVSEGCGHFISWRAIFPASHACLIPRNGLWGREGKGREGKGREGKEREGKGRGGEGREGKEEMSG